MRLGGNARFMTDIHTPKDIVEIYQKAKEQSLPIFILGGGSNLIAHDEGFNGIIARIRIPSFEIIADDLNSSTIKIGAGEVWDKVVKRAIDLQLSGIEAMSAIPGTAGAAPIQNVGAYGQEIADVLVSLEAYDSQENKFAILQNTDCKFSYRSSIFRNESKGRYAITTITIKLSKTAPQPPFYDSLQKYFDEHKTTIFTQSTIREAVMDIRSHKLPDPAQIFSSGSFFKNVIVEEWQLKDLKAIAPNVPAHDMGGGRFKIPAGWLIEFVGLKGKLLHGMRVYEKNAVVLVNESASSYNDLDAAREEIISTVRDTFHLQLEQEPLEIA